MKCFMMFVSLCVLFFAPVAVYAQDNPASYVPENGKVAVDSMCLTIPAAVKLKVDLEYCHKDSELIFDRKYKIAMAEHNATVAKLDIEYSAEKKKLEFLIEEQHKQIGFLNDKIEELDKPVPWYKNNILWFGVGGAAGIGVIVGGAYLLNSIR